MHRFDAQRCEVGRLGAQRAFEACDSAARQVMQVSNCTEVRAQASRSPTGSRRTHPSDGGHVEPTLWSAEPGSTLHGKPVDATHWSTPTLAEHLGPGATTIRRVWRSKGLKPNLARTFKLSRDPRFEDKLLDVVGPYMNPPEHALVLSCDEKSQFPALNRTQPPCLPRSTRWTEA